MAWLSWGILIAACAAAVINVCYLIRFPKAIKWWLRFVNTIALIGFALIYLLMGINYFDTLQPPPILVRPSAILLILLLASETLFDLYYK